MAKPAENTLLNDYHLLTYDVLDSTNAEARRLAGGGASHGAVIWAKRQTAGRGRMGREWVSAEGNLFVTILLNPQVGMAECSQLSFVASLAVAETLTAIVPEPEQIRCKWPNDVLAKGKKISGVLLESFHVEGKGAQPWVAVGIGVNVDTYPEHVIFPATSLREAGVELISAKIVLSRLVHNFIHQYDLWAQKGFAATEKAWLKRAYHMDGAIEVMVGDETFAGTFAGINAEGHLLLREAGKKSLTPIAAGDVFYKEKARAACD